MRIKMLQSHKEPFGDGRSLRGYATGFEYEVDDERGQDFIDRQLAQQVVDGDVVEPAAEEDAPAETAEPVEAQPSKEVEPWSPQP